MKKLFSLAILAMLMCTTAFAQRFTDRLDRGLIAQKATTGVYLSWRILGEEYYDVQYNVYRDGTKLNDKPLNVSNYTDKTGTTTSSYTVAPVVRGVEQKQCAAVTPWAKSYKEIKLTHEGIASKLIPNDACCADVDGDGEVEILMKFDNESEMAQSYPKNGPTVNGKVTGEYSIFEIFKQDGKRLWWVNCGPNMGDFQNNEQNIVGYDWNMDGKAEVIMRLEEGSTIHYADGSQYVIGANGKNGASWTNYRGATGGGTNWFMCVGKEFLVYCDGETGQVLDIIDYPLARLEPGETDLNAAWGDGYGHRASKFFFGAPYLDGKKPSIFLARGIYTQIKMCAFDVDATTNKLVKRWDWRQTNGGYWMWQGYHNFGIADVDEDGRDEIVYGSMVVDDCGKGLSTTGFGHGDAQHCGDFNPYTKGLEIYACNEDQPGNNYRDATTSKVYHRFNSGNDDGRAMMDNFTDLFPGSVGCSAREGAISSVTYGAISGLDATGINTNFRIYWDGDLCSETFNYRNGKNTEGVVAKYGSWSPIYTCEGSMTNNDTKGTPCYQGDILGDWREEIIMRTAAGNVRIYSTPTPTTYRVPTLWSDHQYRNAMVWQMCGYNQPPHVSYFMGMLEGITTTPPPYTMSGREEVANGATVDASYNDKHVILCETNDTKIALANGAKPYILTINVPSWVQGTVGSNYINKEGKINYKYYTCDVESGYLEGDARLIKQGDGILNLPKEDFKHTGETNIWAGTLNFDGSMTESPLWLNRFTQLNSNGGKFRSIKADYASVIRPGGANSMGEITVDTLKLGFGSRVIIDLYSDGFAADKVNMKQISVERKTGDAWLKGGPEYLNPIIEVVGHMATGETKMPAGKYIIGKVEGDVVGSLDNITLEGLATVKKNLYIEDGNLVLELLGMRDASSIVWTGALGSTWDFAESENFVVAGKGEAEVTSFVSQDNVFFTDDAAKKTVSLTGSLIPDSIVVNNTDTYTFNGTGSIDGTAKFIKEGTGVAIMSGSNSYTGGNYLKGGTVRVSQLSNQYIATGNLGGISAAGKFTMENGAILNSTAAVEQGSPMKMVGAEGGVITNNADFKMSAAFSGTVLTKKGSGWLKPQVASSLQKLIVAAGTVESGVKLASSIEMQGTSALTGSGFLTTPIFVAQNAKASLTTVNRATTNLALTGTGKISVYCATEKGSNYYATRTPIQFNLKNFEGTLSAGATYTADGRFTFDTANGSDTWTLDIPAGIIVQNSGKILRVGALTGTGTLGGGCAFSNGTTVAANTWNVGNDTDFKFDGVFTSGDKFTKMGNGKMTVTKAWTSTGAVSVNAGELHLNSGATLGTGALTVAKGASLTGLSGATTISSANAPMTNSSVTVNGTLQVGSTASAVSGFLNFGGKNLTMNAGSTYRVGIRTNAGDTKVAGTVIENINKFTLNGAIQVFVPSAFVLEEGQTFLLWTDVKTFAGTPTVNETVEIIGSENTWTVTWDTSRISEGVLIIKSVALVDDINSIASDEIVTVSVTNINGVVMNSFTCPMGGVRSSFKQTNAAKGIYILNIKGKKAKGSIKVAK